MGFVGGLLGTAGGINGTGVAGPQHAAVAQPVTTGMTDDAYNRTTAGIDQQQAFLQALQAQNGIANQSNVYNQLAQVAAGQGPNPAQAQLAQATAANTANQAALMASQRGAAVNPALIARQAAMQGAANQQNAAGQAASLQAQQSLGAIGQMGNMANQQVAQQGQALQGYNQAAQGQQQNLLNSIANTNQSNVSMQSNINSANAGIVDRTMGGQYNMFGNVAGSIGTAIGLAHGGEVHKGPRSSVGRYMMAKGGQVPTMVSPGEKYLSPDKVQAVQKGASPMAVGETIPGAPKVKGAKDSYANDTVPAMLEEGGIVIPRSVTQSKNPEKKAIEFVLAVMAKNKGLYK